MDHKAGIVDAALLAAIFEGSEDAIITKAIDGAITFWNGGATRLFGYSASSASWSRARVFGSPRDWRPRPNRGLIWRRGRRARRFPSERPEFWWSTTPSARSCRLLQNGRYDLVLMDIQMPVMDGVTATRRIRAPPSSCKDIPIIAMTGNVLPQQVRSFLDAGMNDHVGKPIERAKLYSSVRGWLPKSDGHAVNVALN